MMAENKIFGSAEFYKKALLIAIPVMLQQLIQSLVSLIDLAKVVIFHFWLKKERWLRNLTAEA